MSKCKDCKYAQDSGYEIAGIECCACSLTHRVMNKNAERRFERKDGEADADTEV